jgi:SAM-dependent methyltransferase
LILLCWADEIRRTQMSDFPGDRWYVEAFGAYYPVVYAHRDDESASAEVESLISLLGLSAGRHRVLDVGCGGGRHAAAFRRMGMDAFGLDLSLAMLEIASERQTLEGRLVMGDMRRLPFRPVFDCVVSLFTSFGYFGEEENMGSAVEMARLLRGGGRLVVDHINAAAAERRTGGDSRTEGGVRIRQRRWVDGKRIRKEIEVSEDDRPSARFRENVRLYTAREMRELLTSAGLCVVGIYGSLEGTDLTDASERMVAVAEKSGK